MAIIAIPTIRHSIAIAFLYAFFFKTAVGQYRHYKPNSRKHVCQIEYTRHGSFPSFVANLCSGLIAYSFPTNKPKIHLANGSVVTHPIVL